MKKNRRLRSFENRILQRIFWRRSITILLIFFGFGVVQAQKKNLQVSLSVDQMPVIEVLKILERQVPYKFMYHDSDIQSLGNKSFEVKNVSLAVALDACLKGSAIGYEILNDQVIFKRLEKTVGEMVKITGHVRDTRGESLPGVTVLVKGTTLGVTTNIDGNFVIAMPQNGDMVLSFSFVGMKDQEVKVSSLKPLNVVMEQKINEMDEVVVNGLFQQNRNSYTGSVTSVKAEELLQISPTNLFKALTTLVPGMRIIENNEQGSNPNAIPEIIIRGMTSVASEGQLGLNRPLVMLDGVEISMDRLYDLDMNEIDRIDVLKDASATAIYGDKAANGVIVVIRKRVTDSKLRVRYNFVPNVQFPDVSSFDLCNAREKLELERRYGLYDSRFGEYDELYYEKLRLVNSGVDVDWISKPLRNSWSFNHSLNMSGRGGGMDYSVNVRYGDVRGVMKGDFRQNYGFGVYFSYFYQNKLTVSFRSDWTKTDAKESPYGSFSSFVVINPYDAPKDESGEWVKILSYQNRNPLYDATTNSFTKGESKSFSNSIDVRWDILEGLYAAGSFNYTWNDSQNDKFDSPTSTTWEGETDPTRKGSYAVSGGRGNSWAVNYNLNYNKQFGENTSLLSVHAGGTAQRNRSNSFSFSGIGFAKPGLNDLSFANSYPSGSPFGTETITTSVGWYANVNFILLDRYFVDGSWRVSGGSNYGAKSRYSPYWSAGLGWNIHNENFFKDSFVTLMRLRGSMGYVGSGNFGGVLPVTVYNYQSSLNYYGGIGSIPISMGNDQLKSQRTLKLNVGLNASFFEDRFSATLDLYKENSKDLLLTISEPPSTGTGSVMANLGESVNKGYEWSVSAQVIRKKDLYWRVSLHSSHTENKLKKISNSLKFQNEANRDDRTVAPKIQFEEGESMESIYAVRSLGINPATGREIFIKKDGSLTVDYDPQDKVVVGKTVPKFEGTASTALTWKGFSVSAAFTYTMGGDIYNSTRAAKVENINPEVNVDRRAFTERWNKPGDVVSYVKYNKNTPFVNTDRFVERKNELYLSSLSFSYDFRPDWVKRIGLKKLMVGVGLSDVLRLTTVKYERGTSYPYMRGINFTVSPTF